jgi:hypothetical protein
MSTQKRTIPTISVLLGFGGGALLLLLSMVPFVLTIAVSAQRNLSPLENTLFGTVTFILSTIGSALISAYYERGRSRDSYSQLARPALRRIVAINRSAAQILEAIRDKQSDLKDIEDLSLLQASEWLDSIGRLLQQHIGQLDAAIVDWQELLPEEYAELVNIAELQTVITDKVEQIRALNRQESGDAQQRIGELAAEIVQLKQELRHGRTASGLGVLPFQEDSLAAEVRGDSVFEGRKFDVIQDADT